MQKINKNEWNKVEKTFFFIYYDYYWNMRAFIGIIDALFAFSPNDIL